MPKASKAPAALQRSAPIHLTDEDLCTRDQAAGIAKFSTRFLDMEIKAGRLRALKFGKRSVRIRVADLKRWMNGR